MAAQGTFRTTALSNGVYIICDWEQVFNTSLTTSKIKCDFYLYAPRAIDYGQIYISLTVKGDTSYSQNYVAYSTKHIILELPDDASYKSGRNFLGTAYVGSEPPYGVENKTTTERYALGITHSTIDGSPDNKFKIEENGNHAFMIYEPSTSSIMPDYESVDLQESIYFDVEPFIKLNTIPEMDAFIGDVITIPINKGFSSQTTSITYQFGTLIGKIATKTALNSVDWTIPIEFLNELALGSTHGTCVLTVETFNTSGSLIGAVKRNLTVRMDVNAEGPTFSSVVYDTNPTTIALTGDRNIFVKYYSNVYFNIGASAQYGATITSQHAKNSGKAIYAATGTFEKVESGLIEFSATDNRGGTSTTSLTRTLIPYSKLTCNIVEQELNTDGELTFRITGNYFDGSFGAVNNTLELTYNCVATDGSYNSGTVSVTPNASGTNYSNTITITGLNYLKTYQFYAIAKDKLNTIRTPETLSTGIPVYDWSKDDFNFNVEVNCQENIYLATDKKIFGKTEDGDLLNAFSPCDSIGNLTIGYGGYDSEIGRTLIYGNNVDIISNNPVTVNGQVIGGTGTKVLWEGASHMNTNQSASLSENISDQSNGIVLVFSLYRNGAEEDVSINSFFVSKKEVELLPGAPHTFMMNVNAGFSIMGAKYLYISDNIITGHEGNTTAASNSGITFDNSKYVLRYVIGV